MICHAYKCEHEATTYLDTVKYCDACHRRLTAKRRHQTRVERQEQRRAEALRKAWEKDPIYGPMTDFFAGAKVFTREDYERLCREWHQGFEKAEPSRARERRLHHSGRVALLG